MNETLWCLLCGVTNVEALSGLSRPAEQMFDGKLCDHGKGSAWVPFRPGTSDGVSLITKESKP